MKKINYLFILLILVFVHHALGQEATPNTPPSTPAGSNAPKTSEQQATDAAAREVGRVIGEKIGQDAVSQMTPEDRKTILDRARAATSAERLKKFNFEDSPYYNEITGYIMVLKEGHNQQNDHCLQYQIDLVFRVNRIFVQPVLCEITSDQWIVTPISEIIFNLNGPTSPNLPVPGGWLPPL